MTKKILKYLGVDLVLLIIIYLRVFGQKAVWRNVGENSDSYILFSYATSALFFVMIGVICAYIGNHHLEGKKDLVLELIFYGVPALCMAIYWYVIHLLGVQYFISYAQSFRYVGAIMIGVLIYKSIRFITKKDKSGRG